MAGATGDSCTSQVISLSPIQVHWPLLQNEAQLAPSDIQGPALAVSPRAASWGPEGFNLEAPTHPNSGSKLGAETLRSQTLPSTDCPQAWAEVPEHSDSLGCVG